ncbi:MAG: cbb3-type cytochrome oxidase assembly protein CcoS [Burkholderiales bacterium]|jgi:cbb3-type cytochrome oxidase maturation protein|nr:cbb3-type cytochrome oxidase assembly protein CcoS [Burkholderiales bacterium]
MEILWLLIPMSVLLVLIMGSIFWWSVRSGQFDDLDGPAYRILADDDTPTPEMASEEAFKAENGEKRN